MGKLDGKVAVITGGSTGMALAGAQLFVEEGAYVFIQARRQEALDEAVKLIGRNVTAVQGDAADLADLDRLFDTVKREKGSIDVLWAGAGMGEPAVLGEISEERFPRAFRLDARGTLFTVQKALPLINDNGTARPRSAASREESRDGRSGGAARGREYVRVRTRPVPRQEAAGTRPAGWKSGSVIWSAGGAEKRSASASRWAGELAARRAPTCRARMPARVCG